MERPRGSPCRACRPSACNTTPKPPPVPTMPSTCSTGSSMRCGRLARDQGMRKIHFVSLGCVKNRVDTEVMLGVAAAEGWRIVAEPEDASVIVVNTCGFIGEAKKESIDTIFELAEYKKLGACQKLIV